MLLTECEQVDNSYRWLCKNRKHFPAHADIWHFRFHWQRERQQLIKALTEKSLHLRPRLMVKRTDGSYTH